MIPAVVFANACLTGDAWKNLRGSLTPAGVGVTPPCPPNYSSPSPPGLVGPFNLGVPTRWIGFHAEFEGDIIGKPLLLGDAQWKAWNRLLHHFTSGIGGYLPAVVRRPGLLLLGQPALHARSLAAERRRLVRQRRFAAARPGLGVYKYCRNANNAPHTAPILTASGYTVVGTNSGLAYYRANGTLEASPLTGFPVNCDPRGDHGRDVCHFRRQPVCLDPRTQPSAGSKTWARR